MTSGTTYATTYRMCTPTCGAVATKYKQDQLLAAHESPDVNPDICPQPYPGFGHWFMVSFSVRSPLLGLESQ
jgi:hypothetical protein